MIEIKALEKSYGQVRALDRIDLKIRPGEILGLVGPNGAGKSTLLHCMVGLLNPDAGRIDWGELGNREQEVKRYIGFAPEEPALYPYLTGREFLNFVADIHGIENSADWVEQFFKEFAMQEKADQLIATYSHGMRQKVSLAGAMLFEPRLLLLDEPTNGLDPESLFHLKKRLLAVREKGNTVLFSSHILETVERLCDRIAIINWGKIVLCGTLEQLKTEMATGSLEEIFIQAISANLGK